MSHICWICVSWGVLQDKDDSEFAFIGAHVDEFTVFSDNVLPTVLRHLGILEISAEVTDKIDSNIVIPRGKLSVTLASIRLILCRKCSFIDGRGGGTRVGLHKLSAVVCFEPPLTHELLL